MSLLHKKTAAPGLPEGAAAHGKAGFFRSSSFRRGLLIYIAALAAVLAVLLTVLWQFLRAYERSVPLSAARAYLSSLDGEALTGLFEQALPENIRQDRRECAEEQFAKPFQTAQKELVKDLSASGSEQLQYVVTANGKEALLLRLTRVPGGAGFGRSAWTPAGIEVLPSFVEPTVIRFAAPEDCDVFIDGSKAGASDAEQHGVLFPGMNPLEQKGDRFTVYRIDGLYQMPDVRVQSAAQRLTQTVPAPDGTLFYVREKPELRSFRVTLPKGSVLRIGGTEADPEALQPKPYRYPVSAFEREAAAPEGLTLTLDGFLEKPGLEVLLDGARLTALPEEDPEAGTVFSLPEAMLWQVSVRLPRGALLRVNGIDASGLRGEEEVCESIRFTGIEHYLSPVPAELRITLPALFAEPELSAELDGQSLPLTVKNEGEHRLTVTFSYPPDSLPEEEHAAAERFVTSYLTYVSQGRVDCEAHLYDLLGLMISGTESYRTVLNSYESYLWVRNYKETKRLELTFSDRTVYAENCFETEVAFVIDTVRGTIPVHAEGSVRAVFVKTGGRWLVAAFSVV